MKKQIIAAAVAAAVAVPAMAQNVTVGGVLETGYQRTKINGVDDHTVSPAYLTTNNITFTGTEDLGGGLKATFKLVDEFATNTGAQTGIANNPGTGVFEESSIALSGGFGEIKAGRFNFASRDAGGTYRFGNEFARLSGNFRSLGSQPSNSFQYTSPSLNGLTIALASSNGGGKAVGAVAASTVVATGANQLGYSIKYVNGPLQAVIANTSADVGTASNNREFMAGGQYDFGAFKVGFLYAKETPSAAGAEDVTATVLNLAVPVGNGLTVQLSYHGVTEETAGTATLGGIALVKDLSKRTTLYGGYVGLKNSATMGTAYTVHGIGTVAGANDSSIVAGVRHTF